MDELNEFNFKLIEYEYKHELIHFLKEFSKLWYY